MKFIIKIFTITIFSLLFLILNSCDDPFGFTIKHIKYNYYMENFSENKNSFFLLKKEHGEYINIFEGCTRKIALDNNKIYTKIEKWYKGDQDGIYVLDMAENKTYGPLNKIPEGIKLHDVEIFYKNL